ncbi:non-ribosomal peptide synthetase [Chlorogloea sp. CCALA 695]|uniref:non-ribosomal peptide synthetase n=1 Tax=Chlorogloea sp. CCALA 695 TaxID=2107693 RepID=UPI000D05B7B4|nr:non-ribosomal peptide synthetase [Chlorogloea sp. CCALA 695]PSB35312.1 non-ribosomal peptide synthetase [Chlorogloea sp. CCALA 695]
MTVAGSDRYNISDEEVFVFPASFGQQRLWFLDRLFPNSSCYNVVNVLQLTGLLNVAVFESSFNEIIRRHEVLRTNFDTVDGKPVQLILPELKISISLIDLQPLPVKERESAAQQEIALFGQQPFNLEYGALLRVKLWQIEAGEYVLAFALHHIIFDEWSSALLVRELGLIYTAFCAGKPSPLEEVTIQYADFAHWQREYLQGDVLERQLTYWKSQLQNLPLLEIASHRPLQNSYKGATELLELPQDLAQKISLLSQQEGVTLYMTLLAAFQALLCRYTGQTDIAVGSPIANRNRRELEDAIGFFANSLVIRTDLSNNPSFKEILARVKQVTVDAYAHQDLPFEKLVEQLHPERSLNQNPLFQVVFALQNAPMEQLELPGLTLAPFKEIETTTARFDLEFYLWACGEDFRSLWGDKWQQSAGLRGVLVYNTALFDRDAIALLLQHFQTLLTGAVESIDTKLTDLPLLSVAEENRILREWNQTQQDYQKHLSIQQLFENQVNINPHAIALNYKNYQVTYQQLNHGSNQLARYLQKLGVGKDSLVGICMEQTPIAIAVLLGILKAGAAYVPLDPTYPQERLQFMLEDTTIAVIVTQQSFAHLFFNAKILCLERDWQKLANQSDKNLPNQSTAETLAYIIYTSGSTGIPKGVAVTHQAVNRLINSNYITWKSSYKVAQCANIFFDAATFEIWGALLNGAQLIGIDRETLSPQDFAQTLQQQEIDILFLTTALFNQIAREIPSAFKGLQYLLFGGEMVDVKSVQAVVESKPQHLLHVYGPTENTTFTTWYEVEDVTQLKTIPIGKAIANTQIYLLDNNLNPVPVGVTGEIYIGGDGLAYGYFNRPELTAKQFIAHPWQKSARLYKSGDFARYLPDGNLEFIGRKDDLVKVRGFRIELGEVETVLNQHPKVRESVVVVKEENLVAYIVASVQLKSSQLKEFLQVKLPNYSIPAVFVFLDGLPLTLNGKVDRLALPTPDFTQNISNKTPRNSVEVQLVGLWDGLLGVKAGIDDNFFELGGHSLLATGLVSRIRESFGVQVPLKRVFETPTIAGLAEYIISGKNVTSKIREEVEF